MSKYLKVVIWFFVPIIIPVLILLFFYITTIEETPVVINIKDTYYVIPTLYFISIIALPLGFFISLFRAIYYVFKNKAANYIFLFYSILLISAALLMVISTRN